MSSRFVKARSYLRTAISSNRGSNNRVSTPYRNFAADWVGWQRHRNKGVGCPLFPLFRSFTAEMFPVTGNDQLPTFGTLGSSSRRRKPEPSHPVAMRVSSNKPDHGWNFGKTVPVCSEFTLPAETHASIYPRQISHRRKMAGVLSLLEELHGFVDVAINQRPAIKDRPK